MYSYLLYNIIMTIDKRKYADRAEYLKVAVKKRRKYLKERAVEYKGGKCVLCGYHKCIDALDFHHLDEGKKVFGLSQRGITRSWTRVKTELDKCIIVCANCHREIHAGVLQLSSARRIEK